MKRLYTIIMALATLVVSANAQSLSVQNIEAQMDEETALVVSLAEGSSMTALQFNLSLPEGVTLDETAITKGTAASGHTLEVRPLTNGDRLFVLYHKENTPLANGELLRLPVTVGSEAGTFGGKLYTVRTATADAVSHKAAEANFSVTVKETMPEHIYIETEQTLALTEIPAMKYGDGTYQLPAKTNEGLNLTWTVGNNKVANISGNVLTIKKAGTTSISATQDGNSDYKAFNKSFTLTVAKAPLTITAQNCTKNVGEENPTLTVKYDGFVLGEDETVLTSQPTIQTEATTDSPVGTYDITASGAEAQNYEISYVKGTLTIEKKDEPEPITRNPFKGKIRLPGTLEAENFDRGGEGITYHDNDPGNNGGTNYRSGNDTGVDIVTGNGGYAVGWTNGGEWIEYTMNVTKAGKYTYEAIISNGTGDKGGFSISLVGDGGRLTKLADVGISPTENWDSYQSVKGDLLQSLKTGTQIFRITITAGNCNIDKIKFELKKDEPEPAYRVGDDITSLATAEWEGKTGDYGGLANPSVERYTNGAPEDTGDILTQTISGLRNGTYRVKLEVAASFTPERGFDCPTGDGLSVAFANSTQRNLSVVERGWVSEGEQKLVTLTATVTDGTLKYGIKNLAKSGNWFVARVNSIVYVSESNQTPKTYAISIVSENNGKTTTDVTADEEGSRVFVTATPNEGCTLESIKVATTGGQEVEVTNNSFIMPASAVKVTATYKAPVSDAIEDVVADDDTYQIYTIDGKPVEALQQGVNIIKYQNGTTKKVLVK
ncbi:MAG: carbohydrate-binding protein [Bacteroidaceae bacterium]|nr:carbohydrate-binding protein [Bacteroidaceae bacterium]